MNVLTDTRICATTNCDAPAPMGTGRYCYNCKTNRNLQYHYENKARIESKTMERHYGITSAEYDEILSHQNGVCAICSAPPSVLDTRNGTLRKLHVDHNHLTGEVRGILCQRCNTTLGNMHDDVGLLQKAIEYLTPKA